MGNLLRYLTSFETKDSAVLPNVGDDYTPEEEYENPFGGFTKTLKNTFAKLTSANQHATAGYYWAGPSCWESLPLLRFGRLTFLWSHGY